MSAIEELPEFVAAFHGSEVGQPQETDRMTAWCESADGLAHDAPTAGTARFAAMLEDYAAWIINTLRRPPGWTHTPAVAAPAPGDPTWSWWLRSARPAGYPVDDHSTELRDWCRAWTAANPS